MRKLILLSCVLILHTCACLAQKPAPAPPAPKTPFRWKLEAGLNYYTINTSLPNTILNKPGEQLSIGGKIIWYKKISLNMGAGVCLKSYRNTQKASTYVYDPMNNVYPYDLTFVQNNNILSAEFPATINYRMNSSFTFYGGASFTESLGSFYHNITTWVYHKTLLETTVTKQNGSGGLSFTAERKDNIYATAGIRYMMGNRTGINLNSAYGINAYATTDAAGITKKSNVIRVQLNISYSFGRHKTWEEKEVNWKIKK